MGVVAFTSGGIRYELSFRLGAWLGCSALKLQIVLNIKVVLLETSIRPKYSGLFRRTKMYHMIIKARSPLSILHQIRIINFSARRSVLQKQYLKATPAPCFLQFQ
jgi:hypothetical protein